MTTKVLYDLWLEKATEDLDLKRELESIEGKESEILDRFYKDIEFGTGGLRGVIGAGRNRINIYTVRKVSKGLANYLCKQYEKPSIAIAYDSRIKSDLFAKEAARVFASSGIKVYIFEELMPTPALSFAVRNLSCSAGVVITASHNPSKYNGYKVYGDDGCQITLDMASSVFEEIKKVDMFGSQEYKNFDEYLSDGSIMYVPHETIDEYIEAVSAQALYKDMAGKDKLNIVYTPLNGAGYFCVTNILKKHGFTGVNIVECQKDPDGNFPTCPYPNPEIKEALNEGLKLSREKDADLLLATDPDCDRVGVAIKHKGEYKLLSGNQVGILLFDYICQARVKNGSMPKNPIVIKTIVTTEMLCPIAKKYGVEIIDVLTGFKFIGEQIGYLEDRSEVERYIFGFEESCGYLSGPYVRDKDGVNASLLICEMAAYYKNEGKTLVDVLDGLYEEHGYYETALDSFEFAGSEGIEKMEGIMGRLKNGELKKIVGRDIECVYDYLASIKTDKLGSEEKINLPKSNVLKFLLSENSSVVVRPSGTEPKLKIYYSAQGDSLEKASSAIKNMQEYFKEFVSAE